MKLDPDPRFEAFAAREPFFAVLTAPKFLRANLTPEREREFFESGEELVGWMFDVIERRVAPRFSPMSTLEYGCGVGRLALPLARRPGSITAVDRSPAMLAAARDHARRAGLAQIEFHTAAEFARLDRKFDFVVCFHVLQRLPEHQGLDLLRALVARIASGGLGIFHVPFRTSAPAAVRVSRWARERVPGIDALANALRGRSAAFPLIPSHTYDLDAVLEQLDQLGVAAAHVVFEHQRELSSAIVFVDVPLPSITGVDDRGRPLPGTTLRLAPPGERPIDVKKLIEGASIEELNRTAEQYFASLKDWDDQLAKPFSKPIDAPPLLSNLATLLHGLRLKPGLRVLEFGAGTGWLARSLSQLGCEMILLDVSPTALRIARDLYARLPIIGDRPAPAFLEFDGRRIGLPDASVDRVLSFDAFHHVANPDDVLREIGRILKPGGIAGFAEPGARHSDTSMSQFEMRTYHVVENDIDVHAIWRTASHVGFKDLKLALFHGPPSYVSLAEYEDFLAGGQTTERWLTSTRVFLRDVRHFFLFKAGEEPADSRTVDGLASTIAASTPNRPIQAGQPIVIEAVVTNSGTARWLPAGMAYGGVRLGAHLYELPSVAPREEAPSAAPRAGLLDFEIYGEPLTDLPRPIDPGETVRTSITIPPQQPGRYRIELDCVASRVTWFAQVGSKPAVVEVVVRAT